MFTEFDILVILILLVYSFVVFNKGLIVEILDLICYLGSAFFTYFFYSYALQAISPQDTKNIYINFGVVFGLFIISYILLYLFKLGIVSAVGGGVRSFFDKFLGLIFGFAKGFLIASLAHFIIVLVLVSPPEWLTKGATYSITEYGQKTIIGLLGDKNNLVIKARNSGYESINAEKKPLEEKIEEKLPEAEVPEVPATINSIEPPKPLDKAVDKGEEEKIHQELKKEINKEMDLDGI
jgi:uncharacterized membrane protein required for colicin V production